MARRALGHLGDVTIAIELSNRATFYARHWLTQLGVSIRDESEITITGGDTDTSFGSSKTQIRLWDFQVGRGGCGHLATAVSGAGTVIGAPGSPAGTLPADVPEKWCGLYGAILALAEQWRRTASPARPNYDVSAADVMRAFALQNSGTPEERERLWHRNRRIPVEHGGIFPMGFFRCQDGYVALLGRSRRDWINIRQALDSPEWAEEERFANPFVIAADSAEADRLLEVTLSAFSRDELLARGLEHGAVIAPVYSSAEAREREVFREAFDAEDGPALPFLVTDPAGAQPQPPLPRATLSDHKAHSDLPLAGMRVLELCWVWSGPMVGQTLADLGAEVIKIESDGRFDLYRTRGLETMRGKMPEAERLESSLYFHSLNRNKVGFTVDLKSPEGLETMKSLVASSDMLLDNFTAGTLARLGLDEDTLFAANPALTIVSMSGPGQGSRLAALRSYGLVLSALGGIEDMIAVDGEFMGSPTYSLSDPNAALFACLAGLGGVLCARARGYGVAIDVSQIEAAGTLAGTMPITEPGNTYTGVFATGGEELGLSVPAGIDAALLREELQGLSVTGIAARCEALGIAWCPVLELSDTDGSEIFDLDGWLDATHPVTGAERLVAAPWRIDGRRSRFRKPAPRLGEDNDYVQGILAG